MGRILIASVLLLAGCSSMDEPRIARNRVAPCGAVGPIVARCDHSPGNWSEGYGKTACEAKRNVVR